MGLQDKGTLRFIPACAGNSLHQYRSVRRCSVHPRVCGEQTQPEKSPGTGIGSSPRVRGTVLRVSTNWKRWRFIPACAGNRRCSPLNLATCAVHPRVCGEQRPGLKIEDLNPGSSPRVQGTVSPRSLDSGRGRFIPACAGNRKIDLIFTTRQSVHPRVCGEQVKLFLYPRIDVGSSPRVRGTEYRH